MPYVSKPKGQHPMPKATKGKRSEPYLATESAVTRPHAPIDNDVHPNPIYPAHTIITSFPFRLTSQCHPQKELLLCTIQRLCRAKKSHTNTHRSILVVLVLVGFALFADRDLDALASKSPAERRAFDHAGEFLCRVDLEGLGVGPG
jgi:hypothetical protein